MSAIGEALSYIATTIASSGTASSCSSVNQTPDIRRPIEDNASYFPEDNTSTESSGRSSLSDDGPERISRRPQQLRRAQTGNNPLEAMARNYAAPTEEVDIAKQLALEPQKRSLHDSLKRNATFERAPKVEDAETKAKKLAAAKAELRAMAGTF